jgi:hypothetical protein
MTFNGRKCDIGKGKQDEEGGGREVLEEGLFPETSGHHH